MQSQKPPFRMVQPESFPRLLAWGAAFPGHSSVAVAQTIQKLHGPVFKDLAWRIEHNILLEEHLFLVGKACAHPRVLSVFPGLSPRFYRARVLRP